MVKKALTMLTSILIALPLLMPFNIFADTLPQSEIVGVTYNKIDQNVTYLNSTGTYTYVYEIEVLLKNKYVGVVDGTLSYSYSEVPQGQTVTVSKRTYVNGDSFKLNVSIVQMGSVYTGGAPMYSASFLVNAQNTNVTKYEDLNSIDTVVSILQDIYSNSGDIENLSTNQLAELEKIVQNTSLANEYLQDISELRQFNIPFESFTYVRFMFNNNRSRYNDLYERYYWNYPIFQLSANDTIFNAYPFTNVSYYIIFYSTNNLPNNNINQVKNVFNVPDNIDIVSVKDLGYDLTNNNFALTKLEVKYNTSNRTSITVKYGNTFVPIYSGLSTYKNFSTDFALNYGLSNQMLDDLHVIANGTAQSSSAASSNDLANEQLQTDSNTLFTQEDNFKSDMQSAMQNVNNTFRLQDMGSKFVSSAQWVRTQYEQLTNNTPFASLITFSLITGLALILLGKVYR